MRPQTDDAAKGPLCCCKITSLKEGQRLQNRHAGYRCSHRRNSLTALADWANCQRCGIVSLAIGAWETVPDRSRLKATCSKAIVTHNSVPPEYVRFTFFVKPGQAASLRTIRGRLTPSHDTKTLESSRTRAHKSHVLEFRTSR
jgi:hypothetical protein